MDGMSVLFVVPLALRKQRAGIPPNSTGNARPRAVILAGPTGTSGAYLLGTTRDTDRSSDNTMTYIELHAANDQPSCS
jgi:hypothetical protein